MSFTIDPVAQEHINRKTLVDWIRITGLRISRRTSFDQLLQNFSTKIVEYAEDKPNAFSWPVQAGATQTGPAIRKVGSKVEVNIVKGLIRFGNEQPMSPTTAAIKLNVDMTKWNGSKLEDLLTLQEKKDLDTGKLTYGSIKIDGVKENTSTTSNEPTDDIGPNTPKRKRTLSDYIKTKAYNSVRHHDVAEVIQRVSSRYPKAKMFGCGFSMGGMVLLNYLATCTAETAVLSGALVVSAPFDPHSTTSSLEKFFAKNTYNRLLTKKLVGFAERYREHYENHEMMDFNNVLKSVTIREFDTRFTAPLFGYDSVDHYYDHAAPNKKVKKIPIPTLCLNADDDCFSPYDAPASRGELQQIVQQLEGENFGKPPKPFRELSKRRGYKAPYQVIVFT
ncbi:hypothetical protein Q1695_003536 [Nippostrongylus brasiliensis]|nr:hypothetical protein Q1695_003536 [Nippostrongylus brasiliensis]